MERVTRGDINRLFKELRNKGLRTKRRVNNNGEPAFDGVGSAFTTARSERKAFATWDEELSLPLAISYRGTVPGIEEGWAEEAVRVGDIVYDTAVELGLPVSWQGHSFDSIRIFATHKQAARQNLSNVRTFRDLWINEREEV